MSRKIYLLTSSMGISCVSTQSLARARKIAAYYPHEARYFAKDGEGDLCGYQTRADMHADRHSGEAAVVVIRVIDDPETFLADEDQPYQWRESVAFAGGIDMPIGGDL